MNDDIEVTPMRKMIRMLMLFLICCLLLTAPALADDVCTVKDASAASHITTECAYLNVQCPLEASGVTITVRDEWGYLLYQRNYGACTGTFRSGDIHLPLEGESADYTVTLSADGLEYAFTVTREAAKITDSAVYAGGLTLKELNGGSSRKYAVVLDLDALNQESAAAPMLAGGMQVGEVYFSVLDGKLTVSAVLTVDGQIDKANVYIATDAITAQTLGSSRFSGMKTKLNRTIDLGDAPYAAVMVQLTVTYDPATAQAFELGREEQRNLTELTENWQLMQMTTANEAVG